MFWLLAYVAAMFGIALPVAWFGRNEVAGAVFAVWCVGQIAYALGFPEPLAQVLLYGGAFTYLMVRRHQHKLNVPDGSLVAVAMFVPLLLVCWLWLQGNINRDQAWWPIWVMAMFQTACLIRPISWAGSARRWLSHKTTADPGGSLMVRA